MSWSTWSYAATVSVKPFAGYDDWGGGATYGAEFDIRCTWSATKEPRTETGGDGQEFVVSHYIYTDDPRVKYLDQIKVGDRWETVRRVDSWDVSAFGEQADYRIASN